MSDDESIRTGQSEGASPDQAAPDEEPKPGQLERPVDPYTRLWLRTAIAAGVVLLVVILFFWGDPLFYFTASLFSAFLFEAVFLYYIGFAFVFLHYRYVRQNELLFVLAGAAEANQPLQAALSAYNGDRPQSPLRHFADAVLLSAVFPGFWFWHRWRGFDAKVRRLARLLDTGMPLSVALRVVPGVAARETILAASVGESTGKLGQALKQVPKWRLTTIWIDLLPRLLYPLCLLAINVFVVSFFTVFIIPRFEDIIKGFGMKPPPAMDLFMAVTRWFVTYWFFLFCLVVGVVGLFFYSSTFRWYLPVLGRFSRMFAQSRVLKMLGLLLQTGQPVPQALRVLLGSGYFQGLVGRRLMEVCQRVDQGDDLSRELHRKGLLPASMVPLVQSAQKMNNLPWALEELGEHQAKRTATAVYRFCMALFPISIILVAVVIGFVALSLFSPLWEILYKLTEGKK